MAVSTRVVIERLENATGSRATCIMRCLEGSVSPGSSFDTATSPGGIASPATVRVAAIWRYGRQADLLDPPHSAKLEISGDGLLSLHEGVQLSASPGKQTDLP
jgi:hypothetical protein